MYKNFNLSEKEKREILEQHKSHGYKQPLNEIFLDFLPSVKDATEDQLKSSGSAYRGEVLGGIPYVIFNGEKFYEEDIVIVDDYDLGVLPRVENGKLFIKDSRDFY